MSDMMFPLTQSIFAGGIVNLSVGPNEIPFDAHIELLCAHSPFFDKALTGRFLEAETKHISLPEDDPEIFTMLLSWVYRERLGVKMKDIDWTLLCQLWIMADKYQVCELQNYTMTALGKNYVSHLGPNKGNVPPDVLAFIYASTTPSSHLRRAVTDICVWGMDIEEFTTHRGDYPKEFLEDFALQQARKARGLVSNQLPLLNTPEAYHVKTTGISEAPETSSKQNGSLDKHQENLQPKQIAVVPIGYNPSLWVGFEDPLNPSYQPREASATQLATRIKKVPKGRRSTSGTGAASPASNPSPAPSRSSAPATPPPAVKP